MRVPLLMLAVAFPLVAGCRATVPASEQVFSGDTQGTTYTIKIARPTLSEEQRADVGKTVASRLESIDRAMSTWRSDSDISRFNASQETTPVKVAPELAEVMAIARETSDASGGAFDVTVGPLLAAWGFGPNKGEKQTPSDEELAAIRQRVGYKMVEVDQAACTLRKTRSDVSCDVSGIAQGYTVDKLALDLDALGCTDYMVEVGGEVRARGANARGVPWQIGIEKPVTTARVVDQVVPLANLSLSTSGDYRNYREENGVRLSHTIDPATGRPINHALASVSIVHEQCVLADAFCTALMVLGPEKGLELARQKGLAALFIIHTGDGQFSEKATPGFEQIVQANRPVS